MLKAIGFAGYCGVGKTAAVSFCENLGFGSRVYVGGFVLEEISKANLARTPEIEQRVRLDLRQRHGPGFLAALARPSIQGILDAGNNVLIDAVASIEEAERYVEYFGGRFELIVIESSFENRLARLLARASRKMTEAQIHERDRIEQTDVRTDLLIASANITVTNEGSIEAFYASLRKSIGC